LMQSPARKDLAFLPGSPCSGVTGTAGFFSAGGTASHLHHRAMQLLFFLSWARKVHGSSGNARRMAIPQSHCLVGGAISVNPQGLGFPFLFCLVPFFNPVLTDEHTKEAAMFLSPRYVLVASASFFVLLGGGIRAHLPSACHPESTASVDEVLGPSPSVVVDEIALGVSNSFRGMQIRALGVDSRSFYFLSSNRRPSPTGRRALGPFFGFLALFLSLYCEL